MRVGQDLQVMAKTLQVQLAENKDFIVPTGNMIMNDQGEIIVGDVGMYKPTQFAIGQISDSLKIPRTYTNRMIECGQSKLLSQNVNTWLCSSDEKKKMIRTSGPTMRAYLSSRYRPLDNWDLLSSVLPTFQEKGLQIKSCDLSETKLYIKATMPTLRSEVKVGEVVEAGIVISNSEVGASSLRIEPLIYVLKCQNGLIMNNCLRRFHIGKDLYQGDGGVQNLLRDETKDLIDAGFWATVRDVVYNSLTEDVFMPLVNKMREASDIPIEGKVEKVVEVTRKRFGWSEALGSSILESLIRDGDLTKMGLSNAITYTSQQVESYELATNMEEAGGEIVLMGPKDWEVIAKAA